MHKYEVLWDDVVDCIFTVAFPLQNTFIRQAFERSEDRRPAHRRAACDDLGAGEAAQCLHRIGFYDIVSCAVDLFCQKADTFLKGLIAAQQDL